MDAENNSVEVVVVEAVDSLAVLLRVAWEGHSDNLASDCEDGVAGDPLDFLEGSKVMEPVEVAPSDLVPAEVA